MASSSSESESFTADDLRILVSEFAEICRSGVGSAKMPPLFRWTLCFVQFLLRAARALVLTAWHAGTCFVHYQSDGWSCFVSARHVDDCKPVRFTRSDNAKKEFLLERSIYKSISTCNDVTSCFFITPPRPLDKGMKGWNIFQASCGHTGLLRQAGHTCLVLSH